jgi:hypothetical protein
VPRRMRATLQAITSDGEIGSAALLPPLVRGSSHIHCLLRFLLQELQHLSACFQQRLTERTDHRTVKDSRKEAVAERVGSSRPA